MNRDQFANRLSSRPQNGNVSALEMERMYRQYVWEQEMMQIPVSSTSPIGSGPQFPGDYRSRSSGDWNDPSTWERQEGTTWVPAKTPPGSINDVYIQDGDAIYLTADGSCRNLNLNADLSPTDDRRLNVQQYTLAVHGKLRSYSGARNVIPGTNAPTAGNSIGFIQTGETGKIQFVGKTRDVFATGEWASPVLQIDWNLDFFMDSQTEVAGIRANLRAKNITITRGIAQSFSGGPKPDGGAFGTGTFTIKTGATYVTWTTGLFRVSMPVGEPFGTFTLEPGGFYIMPNVTAGAALAAVNVAMDGTVVLTRGYFPGSNFAGAHPVNVFENLVVQEAATLSQNITVNGTLTLNAKLNSTASAKPTIGPSGSIVGASNLNFVNGPLGILSSSESKVLVFEIGKGSDYRRALLDLTHDSSTPTLYTAEVFNTAPTSRTLPPSLTNVSSVRYWNVVKGSGANVLAAEISLDYGVADGVTAGSKIAVENGSAWADIGGTGAIGSTGTITSTSNFTTFGDFVLADVT